MQKSIQEDQKIADDKNEDQAIRERVREIITENQERIDALENQREELEGSTSTLKISILKKFLFNISKMENKRFQN